MIPACATCRTCAKATADILREDDHLVYCPVFREVVLSGDCCSAWAAEREAEDERNGK